MRTNFAELSEKFLLQKSQLSCSKTCYLGASCVTRHRVSTRAIRTSLKQTLSVQVLLVQDGSVLVWLELVNWTEATTRQFFFCVNDNYGPVETPFYGIEGVCRIFRETKSRMFRILGGEISSLLAKKQGILYKK